MPSLCPQEKENTAAKQQSVEELLAAVMTKADAMGPVDPDFDQKKFFDELWEI
jgi:hypothetical protein